MFERTIITADNIKQTRAACSAIDQRAEFTVGAETWGIAYEGGQRGRMTVWPEAFRGAVMWGGDSHWGDWNSESRILTLDDTGSRVNDMGEVIGHESADGSAR